MFEILEPDWRKFCKDIDECKTTKPCQNGAECHNTDGSYTCNCKPGYKGNDCETKINECQSSPCQNILVLIDV